jgi:hypothetical protein
MQIKSHHLLRNHDNCLDRESPVAEVKEILQTWSKEVNDQNVVESFLAKIIDIRYSGYANQCEPERQVMQNSRQPTKIL